MFQIKPKAVSELGKPIYVLETGKPQYFVHGLEQRYKKKSRLSRFFPWKCVRIDDDMSGPPAMPQQDLDHGTWIVARLREVSNDDERPKQLPIVLDSLIGRGSFGKVYRALWDGKQIAVKVLYHGIKQEDTVAHEINLMLEMNHPNILSAYDYLCWHRVDLNAGQDVDSMVQTWIMEELCDHGTLSDAIRDGIYKDAMGRPLMLDIATVLVQVAEAMEYMHSRGTLHGDLKSGNVLLCSSPSGKPVAKVADFGLSRVLVDLQTYINTRTLGTLTHMSPEMLRYGRMSTSSDVYSFGMLAYELLTGDKPYLGLLHGTFIEQVMVFHNMPHLPPQMVRAFSEMLQRCWDVTSTNRPTFTKVAEQLRILRDGLRSVQMNV